MKIPFLRTLLKEDFSGHSDTASVQKGRVFVLFFEGDERRGGKFCG